MKRYSNIIWVLVFISISLVGCVTLSPAEIHKLSDNELISQPVWVMSEQAIQEEMFRRHPEWKEEVRQAIRDHNIKPGMSREQVLLSWGKPNQESSSNSLLGSSDIWTYGSFSQYGGTTQTVYFLYGKVVSIDKTTL